MDCFCVFLVCFLFLITLSNCQPLFLLIFFLECFFFGFFAVFRFNKWVNEIHERKCIYTSNGERHCRVKEGERKCVRESEKERGKVKE